jgi:exodeoxyribonuclease III
MPQIKLCSWNVNGIRSVAKKGFIDWINHSGFDVVCLQETKALEEQLDKELLTIDKYPYYHFNSALRKGYSGVANYFQREPSSISNGFNEKFKDLGLPLNEFNSEGRIIASEHQLDSKNKFILFNIYFPNGGANEERLKFKLQFYDLFLIYMEALQQENPYIIVTGDYNTAHHEIDLARPQENINTSGFMPIERVYLDRFQGLGFIDSFRYFYPQEKDAYTWWSFRTAARKRNVGWRIDYFFVSKQLKPYLHSAEILNQIQGSDHCPVAITLAV